jgi:hypothetical protein
MDTYDFNANSGVDFKCVKSLSEVAAMISAS